MSIADPVINVSTTLPAQSVTVTITYPADSLINEYKLGDTGIWSTYSGDITVTENTTVYARAQGSDGIWSNEVSQVINNIDTTAPTVTVTPAGDSYVTAPDVTLSTDESATIYYTIDGTDPTPTIAPVITVGDCVGGYTEVTITYASDSKVKQYKIDDGELTDYTGPIVCNKNCTITAYAEDAAGNGIESVANVTNVIPESMGITVEPSPVMVPKGLTQQLAVTRTWTDGNIQDVTAESVYSSSNTGIATVSVSGEISGIAEGQAIITVVAGGDVANVDVNVTPAIVVELVPSVVEIRLPKGLTEQLTIIGNMSDGTQQDVTGQCVFTSGNEAIATVDSLGLVTMVSQGSTAITVTCGEAVAQIPTHVLDPVLSSLVVIPSSINEPKGRVVQLEVQAVLTDNSMNNVTDLCTYSTSDFTVATVTASGSVKAESPGQAMITVGYQDTFADVPVTVIPAVVDQITLLSDKTGIPKGRNAQLTVRVQMSDGEIKDVTAEAAYSVDHPDRLLISSTGLVTAIGEGTATVSATYLDATATISILVSPAVPDTLVITPEVTTIYMDRGIQFTAVVVYSDQSQVNVTNTAIWEAGQPNMVSIQAGYVTGLKLGNVNITISSSGLSRTISLNIVKAGVFRLMIDRCVDNNIKGYRVMRRSKFNPHPVKIMDVVQPAAVNPIEITEDRLKFKDNKWYSSHGNILSDRQITVLVNSVQTTNFTADLKAGIFNIPEAGEGDVVVASYTFDGVSVLDSATLQPGVVYHGPMPIDDSQMMPPINTTIEANSITNQVVIKFEEPNQMGTDYYYHWVAYDDRGNESVPSDEVVGKVMQLHPETPYKLEKCSDGVTWELAKYDNQTTITDGPIDIAAPDPVTSLDAEVITTQAGNADIRLTWEAPAQDRFTQSPVYRVRFVNAAGVESEPGVEVGPVSVRTGINKIIVRRMVYQGNGIFPSFDGDDAETVAELSAEVIMYDDRGLADQTVYAYSVFAVDNAGNHSTPATALAEIGDLTPPEQPAIQSAESKPL